MPMDRSWDLSVNQSTDPSFFRRRRKILAMLGVAATASAGGLGAWWYRGTDEDILDAGRETTAETPLPPVVRSDFTVDAPITKQASVARFVNFYEFNPHKFGTWRKAAALPTHPWTISIDGLVQRPLTLDVDALGRRFGLEERTYRHRCVETWAMIVPWLGIPLAKVIELAQPKSTATHVRFLTADIRRLTGIRSPSGFQWPYQEGLTIAEGMNPLAFLATGFYGEPLFKQNGAPVRVVLPWKYGFKSAKSLVRIELVDARPNTFWNQAMPKEYGFYANVDPAVDHPRWSQKTEWMIDTREKRPTKKYNGYGEWVGQLYTGTEV